MTVKLGLAPAIVLQKRISGAAFFTGLMIYFEGLVALVLLTEEALSFPSLIPVVLVSRRGDGRLPCEADWARCAASRNRPLGDTHIPGIGRSA